MSDNGDDVLQIGEAKVDGPVTGSAGAIGGNDNNNNTRTKPKESPQESRIGTNNNSNSHNSRPRTNRKRSTMDEENDTDEKADDEKIESPPLKRQRLNTRNSNNSNTNVNNSKDKSQESMSNLLQRIVKTTCGKCKFLEIKNPKTDALIVMAMESNIDLERFCGYLKEELNLFLGQPQVTVHECPQHLQEQLDSLEVSDISRAMVHGVIENNNLEAAVHSLVFLFNTSKYMLLFVVYLLPSL